VAQSLPLKSFPKPFYDKMSCIKIGKELALDNLADLSLVSSKYNTSKGQGVIAVFGPKRMDYSKL